VRILTLATLSVDESEYFLQNHHASVAALRLLFATNPERRSASLRNQRSPSLEYPLKLATSLRSDVEKWIRTTRPELFEPTE